MEDYVHRIGRTGRAGAQGISVSFLTQEDDANIAKELIEFLIESEQDVIEDLRELADSANIKKPKPYYGGNNYKQNNFNKNRGNFNNNNNQYGGIRRNDNFDNNMNNQ